MFKMRAQFFNDGIAQNAFALSVYKHNTSTMLFSVLVEGVFYHFQLVFKNVLWLKPNKGVEQLSSV